MKRRKISAAGEGHSWHGGETTMNNFRIEVRRQFPRGKTTLQRKEQGKNLTSFKRRCLSLNACHIYAFLRARSKPSKILTAL